ncbi:MAG: hypothetical protein WA821_04195 [Anaerolineales bacterium]
MRAFNAFSSLMPGFERTAGWDDCQQETLNESRSIGFFLGIPALLSLPFFLCGGLKIGYDLLLFREFRAVKPPEEGKG